MSNIVDKARSKFKDLYATYVPSAAIPGMHPAALPAPMAPTTPAAAPQDALQIHLREARYSYQTTSTSKSYQSLWSQSSSPPASSPPRCPPPSVPPAPF